MTLNSLFMGLVIVSCFLIGNPLMKVIMTLGLLSGIFFLKNQHVTLSLIQLELVTLVTGVWLLVGSEICETSKVFILVVLTVAVLEASTGLSLLARTSRMESKELFKMDM